MNPASTSVPEGVSSHRKTGCFLAAAGIAAALFCLIIGFFPDCSATSKQARFARSLPAVRLEQLHRTMAKLYAQIPEKDRDVEVNLWKERMPSEFDDLHCVLVRVGGTAQIIRLQGCMDHFLDMRFYGVGEPMKPGSRPRITLVSGEFAQKEELLWQKNETISEQDAAPLSGP